MLHKTQRLRNTRDFKKVYARGRSFVHPLLVLYVLPNRGKLSRIGFSISKKLGGAVERNRIKRRLREVCRTRIDRLQTGFDFILVGRSRIKEASSSAIQAVVDELFLRAKVLAERPVQRIETCSESPDDSSSV